ncbi:MAG TPA: YceI family protein [Vicinamibacterales bacterium]|nr:YceI family protein [Vicinamibacterales bacterium]HOG28679.1 YceI family protein [Vicinamibacterales bacterium]HOQ59596.1 YceI family protein [Vicinamibacterales bacterium]HPK72164.1 YceI family protein [Vicinamibacterales bacterium]HPW19736.1 YceI family protein [Vicinamibacterales bacterium]
MSTSRTFTIDKTHSEATFQVRHLVTKVRGHFSDLGGTIQADEAHPERSSVTFTIQAASIDTGTPDRDAHLRAEDFFHVEKYPAITFVSTSIVAAGGDRYDVTGDLTMRGVTKRITLPVTFLGSAKDPWGHEKIGFETETTLNRKDFGLTWNAALETGGLLVGDEVKVSVSIQAAPVA